jgi:hypothetical protein
MILSNVFAKYAQKTVHADVQIIKLHNVKNVSALMYIYCALVGVIKDSVSQNARCNSENYILYVCIMNCELLQCAQVQKILKSLLMNTNPIK